MKKSSKLKDKLKKQLVAIISSIMIVVMFVAGYGIINNNKNNPNQSSTEYLISENKEIEVHPTAQLVTEPVIAEDGAIECDSIIQGVRDIELVDGTYTFRVKGKTSASSSEETKEYLVELINYYDDVHYTLPEGQTSTTVSLGDETTDKKMLVVKYHGNLIIDKGVTLTALRNGSYTYKKGMYLCVLGKMINNGEISMTGRTGGGGTGATGVWALGTHVLGGSGGRGTAYSGGAGGGGSNACINEDYESKNKGTSGSSIGGAGGSGKGYGSGDVGTGGGAGNPGGSGWNRGNTGSNGTGGLLIVYTKELVNNGKFASNGLNGGYGFGSGGGGSGGGSINLFIDKVDKIGSFDVAGGSGGSYSQSFGNPGGSGGYGSITVNAILPDIQRGTNQIELNLGSTYSIDNTQISFISQNEIQTGNLELGELSYEVFDNDIASVDENGVITGLKEGITKVKITESNYNLSTYIYITVINNVKIDVQEGKNFTMMIKMNQFKLKA